MKPLKLTMTAFGPYKNAETIDFRELQDNDLYVISGNTGAGKTTIFDGICFALYGTASGEDRENYTLLRSDFADDDVHTSVEFEFELKGRTYRILRQLGHIKQGNKSKTGDNYEFYELTDDGEIPCVDRQIVSEINKKVEALLGLTEDQFKQIVMLPQGEFRKLLTSETENKEEILRRLFKTDDYQQMGERLRERKSMAEEKYQQVRQTRDTYIEHIKAVLPERDDADIFQVLAGEQYNDYQILTALEKEIDYYQKQMVNDEKMYHKANEQYGQMQETYHQAKAINERFADLTQKEAALEKLIEQRPNIERKENLLERAERASKIEPEEERLREWREDQTQKEKQLTQAQKDKLDAESKLDQAKKAYETEEKNKEQRQTVGEEVTRLKEYYPTVEQIDQNKQALTKLKQQVDESKREIEALKTELNKKETTFETNQQTIKSLEETDSTRLEKHQTLLNLRDHMKKVMAYEQVQATEASLKKDVQRKKQIFDQAKEQYNQLEASWLNNQAAVLASHLHDGEACPVCGSVHHPEKTTHEQGDINRETLDNYKKTLDQKESDYRETATRHSGELARLRDRESDLQELNIDLANIKQVKTDLQHEGVTLKTDVEQLNQNKQRLDQLKQVNEQLNREIKQFKQQLDVKEASFHKENQTLAGDIAAYQERLRTIPEELQRLSVLKEKMTEQEALQKRLENQWEVVQKNLQAARETFTKIETDAAHAEKQLADSKQKRQVAEERFNTALQHANFQTEAMYRDAKRSLNEQQNLKEEIKQFNQALSTTKEQVNELKTSLQNQEKADLNQLAEQLEALKNASEQASQTWHQTKNYYSQAATLKEKISETSEQALESERDFNVITDLYNVIRGQNSRKLSFERYLQIDYLEQIIEASNYRLRDLSNGQFSLMRSDRQEARGKQSGLSLDVYDEYTGQTRDVKSLSGGEKFNASLCLALGMSDVIQSFEGNISIETMFIDEGFGSLDEESLNKSIDALVDLQQTGRMIGVISHVQELKAIFPAILEVTKTKEGYSETNFIVK